PRRLRPAAFLAVGSAVGGGRGLRAVAVRQLAPDTGRVGAGHVPLPGPGAGLLELAGGAAGAPRGERRRRPFGLGGGGAKLAGHRPLLAPGALWRGGSPLSPGRGVLHL